MAKKKSKTQSKIEERIPAEVRESVRSVWLAGLGALSAAEEEGSKLFKSLVEKGENYEAKGKEAIDDARQDVEDVVGKARGRAESSWDRVEDRLDESLSGTLRRFGVPTREEISTLTQRVEELTRLVEGLKQEKAPATKTAAKKTPAKSSTTEKATSA